MDNFALTQSGLKDLEKADCCPYRWEKLWIEQAYKTEPTDRMMAGSYFEYLALGAGARDGEDITDLPRLKNGSKTTSQIRIEEQAELFKKMHNPEDPAYIGWIIKEKQVKITDKSKAREGTIDYIAEAFNHPEGIPNGTIAVFDLKFTADVDNEWGDYCWGRPEKMDLIQQVLYRDLGYKHLQTDPMMFLLIFDDSPKTGRKLLQIEVTKESHEKMEDRFAKAWEALWYYKEHGFPQVPGRKECLACPLQCPNAFNQESTDVIKLNY